MHSIKRIKWFQQVAIGIASLFFGMIFVAVILAYSRPSGATGIDMAKVQLMRQQNP